MTDSQITNIWGGERKIINVRFWHWRREKKQNSGGGWRLQLPAWSCELWVDQSLLSLGKSARGSVAGLAARWVLHGHCRTGRVIDSCGGGGVADEVSTLSSLTFPLVSVSVFWVSTSTICFSWSWIWFVGCNLIGFLIVLVWAGQLGC